MKYALIRSIKKYRIID